MDMLGQILYDTVYHSAPIILCVIGGVFAYKANVLNIALEGMMAIGAFVSVLVTFLTPVSYTHLDVYKRRGINWS